MDELVAHTGHLSPRDGTPTIFQSAGIFLVASPMISRLRVTARFKVSSERNSYILALSGTPFVFLLVEPVGISDKLKFRPILLRHKYVGYAQLYLFLTI